MLLTAVCHIAVLEDVLACSYFFMECTQQEGAAAGWKRTALESRPSMDLA